MLICIKTIFENKFQQFRNYQQIPTIQKLSSLETLTEMFNFHCNLDHSNTRISQDDDDDDDVPPNYIWLQMVQ